MLSLLIGVSVSNRCHCRRERKPREYWVVPGRTRAWWDICEHIWGGSPATQQILSGVESIDIDQEMMTTSMDTAASMFWNLSVDEDDQSEQAKDDSTSPKEKIFHRLQCSKEESYWGSTE